MLPLFFLVNLLFNMNFLIRHLSYWLERAEQCAIKLDKLTNMSPTEFLDAIVMEFFKTENKDIVHDAVIKTSRIQKSLHLYEAEVLQLAGVGAQLNRVKSISAHVSDVIKPLEEILCLAMVDTNELLIAYHRKSLLYQKC
jgi:hypothetical protein